MTMFPLVRALDLLLLASLAWGRLYTIPENWTAAITGTEFPAFGLSGSYILVTAPRNSSSSSDQNLFLLSENGTFGLAFLDLNGTGKFYLSVIMGATNASAGAPVWTANRGRAVSNQSRLAKTSGRVTLVDGSDTVWSPSLEQAVASIGLEESGNLVLYNSSGGLLWQSFEHPTDVLLPGQRLVTGQRLTSNLNSTTLSEGRFSATMEASAIVLAFTSPLGDQQPYFLWSLRTPSNIESARIPCPDYVAVLQYTAAGAVNMAYERRNGNTSRNPCSSPLNVGLAPGTSKRQLRLEFDGNLISYKLNETGDWEKEFSVTDYFGERVCDLPLACGSYGVCDQSSPTRCTCLTNVPTNITQSGSATCGAPSWPSRLENCDNRYETDFVVFTGVRYFTNQYMQADTVSSLEDCLGTCRRNCSCSALFYEAIPRNCYFVDDLSGSLTRGEPRFTAYLKFQDRSRLVKLGSSSSGRKNTITIASTVAAATLVVLCSLLLLREFRRKQDKEIEKLITALQGPPQRFTYRTLSLATKRFSKHIGSGGFGSVYEGTLRDGRKLAVKKLHSYKGQKQFIAEVASLGKVSHVNIVRLCGFCAEMSHRLLVYEFMPNGSLDKWIFQNQGPALDWDRRYSIALGTARGLCYLHEKSREPIIHLDIKPQNILLDDNFEAKVGDFGMAKLLMSRDVTQVITGVRGTPGYLAPEWLMHSTATKKCDVYSYGMVLLELIGGRKNLDPAKIESDLSFFFPVWAVNEMKQGRLLNVVDPAIRDGVDNAGAERLVKVAFWCIQENPVDRPSMEAVVQMLEGRQEIDEPPLLFRFSVEAPGIISIKASSNSIALAYCDSENKN